MDQIRPFEPCDIDAIYEIYVDYVRNSTAIFDLEPMPYKDLKAQLLSINDEYPFFVALHKGELIGYAYVHPAFSKEAYRYCVESTIYFRKGNHFGMALPLLKKVEAACCQKGYKWIIACITDTNKESLAFHLKNGYKETGRLPECGYKWGRWHGVIWLCKDLSQEARMDHYLADSAIIQGNVELAEDVNIWHEAVIRGDSEKISIGKSTNIQDMALIHVDKEHPVHIGNNVTIGHKAIIHGATIEDDVLVGMNATIMNGAVIGSCSIIGAGAVVLENMHIPKRSLVVGMPAKVIKEIDEDQIRMIKENAKHYVEMAKRSLNKV